MSRPYVRVCVCVHRSVAAEGSPPVERTLLADTFWVNIVTRGLVTQFSEQTLHKKGKRVWYVISLRSSCHFCEEHTSAGWVAELCICK